MSEYDTRYEIAGLEQRTESTERDLEDLQKEEERLQAYMEKLKAIKKLKEEIKSAEKEIKDLEVRALIYSYIIANCWRGAPARCVAAQVQLSFSTIAS